MTITLGSLIAAHGVDVYDHLARDLDVPVLTGAQAQGDLIVLPCREVRGGSPVPAAGVPVVRGESGGHTHLLLADGPVMWAPSTVDGGDLGAVTVPDGATAWLAHPEHGFTGIGPGVYVLRRQREQADVLRVVAD